MLHGVIIGYVVLFCLATPCLALSLILRRQLQQSLFDSLLRLQGMLLAIAVVVFTFYYVSANHFRIDPFAATIPYEFFRLSPPLYGLWSLAQDLQPLLVYLAVAVVQGLSPQAGGFNPRRLAGVAALALSAIYVAESVLVPVLFHFDFHVADIGGFILALNRVLLIAMVGALAAIGWFWLGRRRWIANPELRFFGDLLAASIALTMGGFLGSDLALNGLEARGETAGGRWLLMLLSQGPWLPSLLLDLAVLAFAAKLLARRVVSASPAAAFAVPEAFYGHYKLSPREREICALLARGLANKEIGARLGITHGSVKNHVSNIFAKLGIATRFEVLGRVQEFDQTMTNFRLSPPPP